MGTRGSGGHRPQHIYLFGNPMTNGIEWRRKKKWSFADPKIHNLPFYIDFASIVHT